MAGRGTASGAGAGAGQRGGGCGCGAVATTGAHNLYAALWLRDLEHLYVFNTGSLAELNVDSVDTVLIGQAVKRPGSRRVLALPCFRRPVDQVGDLCRDRGDRRRVTD